MRLFAALALVFVALLVATVRQAMSTRGRGATTAASPPDVEGEVKGDAPPTHHVPRLSYVAPASGEEGARSGIAHLHGRVLPAPGQGDDTLAAVTTTVFADDGVRAFNVEAADDGQFSLHLPPGRYELSATADQWSGSVADVVARAGVDRAIDIQLQDGATISGVLRGEHRGEVSVIARFAGRLAERRAADVTKDGFEIAGLLAGRRYDLEISGARTRTTILRDVTAPARDLDIELVPLPLLRGAFGFPHGGHCPIDAVTVKLAGSSDDDSDNDQDVGDDCRFEMTLSVAEATAQTATLVATGSGWHVEQTITIPARGDPDPVCLNPPCRANPLDGSARMLVTMEGHDARFTTVRATTAKGRRSTTSCEGGTCVLEALEPNRTYHVTTSAEGCLDEERDIAVTPGDNSVRFTCRGQRKIQGLFRTAGAPPSVDVRCTGDLRSVTRSRLFAIFCAPDDTALQYRVLPDGEWQSAAIPTAEDLPLVEIAL